MANTVLTDLPARLIQSTTDMIDKIGYSSQL